MGEEAVSRPDACVSTLGQGDCFEYVARLLSSAHDVCVRSEE